MTKGELQLRQELDRGLLNGADLDGLIKIIKEGEYFIHEGQIRELQDTDWEDWEDGSEQFDVWVEDLEEIE